MREICFFVAFQCKMNFIRRVVHSIDIMKHVVTIVFMNNEICRSIVEKILGCKLHFLIFIKYFFNLYAYYCSYSIVSSALSVDNYL